MKLALSIVFGLNILLCNTCIAQAAPLPTDQSAMEAAMQTMGHGCPGHRSSDAPPMPAHGEHCSLMPTVSLHSSMPWSIAAVLPVSQTALVLPLLPPSADNPVPMEWPPPPDLLTGTIVLQQ